MLLSFCESLHTNGTPPYPLYLVYRCACDSLPFNICAVFGPRYSTLPKGRRSRLHFVTLQGAEVFVVGAWARHDRDPESD